MNKNNQKDQGVPSCFYKYTTAKTGKKILKNSTVRFSSPLTFNDPFDSQLNIYAGDNYLDGCKKMFLWELKQSDAFKDTPSEKIEKALDYRINQLKKALKKLPQKWKFYAKHFRVFSVSEIFDNLLMWSHYSESHTGIVIGFKKIKKGVLENVRKMNYSRNMPKYALLIDDLFDNEIDFDEFFFENLYLKSKYWGYEKEWRSVDIIKTIGGNFYTDNNFTLEEIDSVYLGCNIKRQNESQIIKIAKNNFPDAKIFQVIKSKKDFLLDFEKINV